MTKPHVLCPQLKFSELLNHFIVFFEFDYQRVGAIRPMLLIKYLGQQKRVAQRQPFFMLL